jgi:outer membrane protein
MKFKVLLFFVLFVQISVLFAEVSPTSGYFSDKRISLEEAICLALRNNPEIRSSGLQRVVDRFALEVARNQFLPQYSFHTSAVYSNGNKPYYTSNPEATFETIYGTKIGLGLQDQVNAGRETAAFFEVTQPLLQGAGATFGRAKYLNAYHNETISRLNYKAAIMNVINEVIKAYYKVVQDYNNNDIGEISTNEALKTLHAAQLQIKAGKMAATEITQQQAQIANLKMTLLQDKNALQQDYRYLLLLLGLDPQSELRLDKHIPSYPVVLPSQQEAINLALANNIQYQIQLNKQKQLELASDVAKNQQKWKLDLTGKMQQRIIRNGNFAPTPIDQIDVIGNGLPNNEKSLTVNLTIPINDIGRKQQLSNARIALKQLQIELEAMRQKIIADVLNNLQDLKMSLQQIRLSKEAVNYTRQSLIVSQKKLLYGRSSMFELTTLQKNLVLQQFELINQQIAFLNNQASFEQLLGITLKKWRIQIRD